ncbi:gluconokinase [Jannaschia seosinensis]|uniref:gluconokinase n=1 Tax=Jannaschia seosinensis TaxID=313367 RepID=UPI0006E3F69D|nr:gluconokinase [Jannaschia seosinensis]
MRNILVMGICGTGKTTLAGRLAERLSCAMIEADEHHAPEAIARMARGDALTDVDRWGWLDRVGAAAHDTGVQTVIACSALKRAYRARLAERLGALDIIFLHGTRSLVVARMSQRTAHYMPTSLIDSQLAVLELPEGQDVLPLDIADPLDRMVDAAHDFATRPRQSARPFIPQGGKP